MLKKYKDESGKPLELINQVALQQHVLLPFSIEATGAKLPFDPNSVLYVAKMSADGLGIDYTYSNGTVTIEKSFHFGKNTYLTDVKSSVREGSSLLPAFLVWRGGFGDARAFRAATTESTVRYDSTDKKLITASPKMLRTGRLRQPATICSQALKTSSSRWSYCLRAAYRPRFEPTATN